MQRKKIAKRKPSAHRKSDKQKRKQNGPTSANSSVSGSSNQSSNTNGTPPHTAVGELTTEQKCNLIAEISEAVLENPATAFSSGEQDGNDDDIGVSKIRQLLDFASPSRNGNDSYVARLAVMSLLILFKDIIPSYRIRLPTAAEMAVKVSKETKKLWDHERGLLNHYQLYLKLLEKAWDSGSGRLTGKQPTPLAVTAMLSMAELLSSAPHFNYRHNLLTIIIRHMNYSACEEVADACCQAIENIFAEDAQGEIALEATRMVAKLLRDRNFLGSRLPSVLRTFVALPLRVHVDEAQAAKLATAAQAKKRKRNKVETDIEKDLREGSTSVDKILLARSQSETLQIVTLTYFRILKSDEDDLTAQHMTNLLPPALEGLAKFAHLINMDTIMDLLAVLRTLLKRVDNLPLDSALNCVLTAFQTLQGPGRELKIDQKEYITPLYTQLPRLCTAKSTDVDLAIRCLNISFLKRREYSTSRLSAFVKALCTVSLHSPASTSAPLLAFVRQLMQRYPVIHQLLENEQDVITSGQYTPDVEDPEHANALATSAWELATLKFHIHPRVSQHARGAATQKLLQMPSESPDRIRENMLGDETMVYIPLKRNRKRHPLSARTTEEAAKRPRFITPRTTEMHHLKG